MCSVTVYWSRESDNTSLLWVLVKRVRQYFTIVSISEERRKPGDNWSMSSVIMCTRTRDCGHHFTLSSHLRRSPAPFDAFRTNSIQLHYCPCIKQYVCQCLSIAQFTQTTTECLPWYRSERDAHLFCRSTITLTWTKNVGTSSCHSR